MRSTQQDVAGGMETASTRQRTTHRRCDFPIARPPHLRTQHWQENKVDLSSFYNIFIDRRNVWKP